MGLSKSKHIDSIEGEKFDVKTYVTHKVISEDIIDCTISLYNAARKLRQPYVKLNHVHSSERSENHIYFLVRVSTSFIELCHSGHILPELKQRFERDHPDLSLDTTIIDDYGQKKIYFQIRKQPNIMNQAHNNSIQKSDGNHFPQLLFGSDRNSSFEYTSSARSISKCDNASL